MLKNYKTNDEVALSRPSERSWYCVRQRSTADAIFGLCDRHCLVWVCMRMFSVQAQFGRVTICQCNSQLRPHDSPKCIWYSKMSCGFYKARTADWSLPEQTCTPNCRMPPGYQCMKNVGRPLTRGAWLLTIAFVGTLLSACGTTPNSSGDGGSGLHTVSLTWNTSTSSNIVGYNVYRGTTSGNYALLKSMNSNTSYLDASVQSGQTYYYAVTAVNAAGAESPYSNRAQAVIP